MGALAGGPGQAPIHFHAPDECTVALDLPVAAPRRGRLRPDRIRVATQWPLGLFNAWSWVYPRIESVVYPRTRDHGLQLPESGSAGQHRRRAFGDEEFSGLRDYHPGDPPRRIAWKVLARTDELYSKSFDSSPVGERWLDWDRLEELDPEERLEQLCFWVLELDRRGHRYGLDLPGGRIGPDRGNAHRHRCLEALALFGLPGEDAA